ncbi:MAG: hypothetical protein HC803_02520 [Saprospiraceae bacterium]|nr:hypothetical protein [Saprospiraceae bacterium]
MRISIIGCGWLGLPLGEFLVQKGYEVKGSTTTKDKLETIGNKGIKPFLINLETVINEKTDLAFANDFFNTDLLYINIPPTRKNPNIETDYPKWMAFLAKSVRIWYQKSHFC